MKLNVGRHIWSVLSYSLPLLLALNSFGQIEEEAPVVQYQPEPDNQLLYSVIVLFAFSVLAIIYLVLRLRRTKGLSEEVSKQKKELVSSQHQYLEIFDFSLDSIITTDPDGYVTNLNRAAEEMLGYSSAELLEKHIKMVYASEDDFLKVIDDLRRYDQYAGEILNKTKDGKVIIVKLSATQIRNPEGEVMGTMGISRDITTESILKKEYNNLINNVSDIIYTTDINGNFTYTNRPVETILGYSANEILNSSFSALIHKEDVDMVANHYGEVFKTRKKESYLEFRVKTKNGKYVWVGQQVNTKFDKFDSSRIEGFYGIVRVIDERKRAELKLQGSEKRYRDLINNSSDLIQVVDRDGNIKYTNDAWKKRLKYTDEDLKGVSMLSLIHEDSIDHCMHVFQAMERQDSKVLKEERILYSLISKDGKKVRVEGSFSVQFDADGKISTIESFLRDVTSQKEAEEQLAQKEKTLRQITETITDVFYLYNIIEEKYEYISPNCQEILGANQHFFYEGNNHREEFVIEEDLHIVNNAKSTVDDGYSYDILYRIIIEGEIRWINEKSFAIRDENNDIVANSGICRDVTEIHEAQETIRVQNAEITASLLYAKRIQYAVLPSSSEINSLLPDSLVVFRPKEVVGGDFYIVEKIQSNNFDDLVVCIVGDCTGHGVPGAVLSLMCNVLVRESFKRQDVNSPAEALDYVRNRLTTFFSATKEKNIRDGMDIAFCAIDFKNEKLLFSGANNNCVMERKGELTILRGNRQHVGYDEKPKPFENQEVKIEKGDRLYLYTDGISDQFGGENGKKFGKPKLHKLLKNDQNLSMNDLSSLLNSELDKWQGDRAQIDDITILGIEV